LEKIDNVGISTISFTLIAELFMMLIC